MSIEITVPILPESVADGLLLEWKKQVGDSVSRDEILVEVETDKVVLEVPATQDGVLTEILHEPGDMVLSGEVLARMQPGAAKIAAPQQNTAQEPDVAPAHEDNNDNDDQPMSPAVRNLVESHGLNPAEITGSGRDGRVTKEDILDFIGNQVTPDDTPEAPPATTEPPATAATSVPPPATSVPPPATTSPAKSSFDDASAKKPEGAREETREPMSRLRQTIAARLIQSQQTSALLTTFNEVNMKPVVELRARYKEEFEKTHGVRLGFMSFFVKASVAALLKFPLVNAHIDGTDIVRHNYCDIGIAVASNRGLVVPILRNCERLNFADIETQIRAFGSRAQDGKIDLDDLIGGTFTLTNGGVFGSLLSTPIVNPPQSAILGMHKIQQRPVAEDGQVVIRPMMYLALTYDHRIIDGQEAVRFLVAIKESLEDPARMLLDW